MSLNSLVENIILNATTMCVLLDRMRRAVDEQSPGAAHRRRQERAVRPLAVAGVGAADVVLRLLEHAPLRRSDHQRALDRDGWPLCGRVSNANDFLLYCIVYSSAFKNVMCDVFGVFPVC